jgi:hypothetical protein
MLGSLGVDSRKVTRSEHLSGLDAIILPGGESTAMVRVAAGTDLFCRLRESIAAGLPVFGTCAGLILLADRLSDDSLGGYERLGGLDITVARNAYGRQRESFTAALQHRGLRAHLRRHLHPGPADPRHLPHHRGARPVRGQAGAGEAGQCVGRQLPPGAGRGPAAPRRVPPARRRSVSLDVIVGSHSRGADTSSRCRPALSRSSRQSPMRSPSSWAGAGASRRIVTAVVLR